jgi:hypothetical protein
MTSSKRILSPNFGVLGHRHTATEQFKIAPKEQAHKFSAYVLIEISAKAKPDLKSLCVWHDNINFF